MVSTAWKRSETLAAGGGVPKSEEQARFVHLGANAPWGAKTQTKLVQRVARRDRGTTSR